MPTRKKIILALTAISLSTTVFKSAIAQNVTDVNSLNQENVTLTGESLQGIEPKSVNNNTQGQTFVTEVTIEREQPQNDDTIKTGNEFIDSFMTPSTQPTKPVEEGLNNNLGDRPNVGSGTVPLVHF